MTQRMIEITSPYFIAEGQLSEPADWTEIFGSHRPLALEIGCGIGDFMVQLAARHPETNFLAIDIYNKGCLKTCRKIEAAGLDNVRVLRAEARFLLAHFIEREALCGVYINCPDPWPKKRHRQRRLVNREFLRTLLYYLQPGGELYFSTDFVDYAYDVADLLPAIEGYQNRLAKPFVLDLPGYPRSKYMRRFLDLGQPVHFIHYRKDEALRADESLLAEPLPGFRVRWSHAQNG